ncbi:MAG: MerR family transcriptional regulator [Proteobacteria bacterium]|nr:MerR family transcriptional regulator [Pseudomonadota bacterium]
MKIGELAKKANVSKETIHYYIREGVLKKPRKTGKNMAEYADAYIDQIRTIKELRDNYYLPLPVIKKIITKYKKQSYSERHSFRFLSEYFRPLDLLLSDEITGKEDFLEATGMNRMWLEKMETWGIVLRTEKNGESVYSRDSVIIGKLLVDMDRIGFGPRNGYDPEKLKPFADFLRSTVSSGHKHYLLNNMDNPTPEELSEKARRVMEIFSLYFYHLYRQFAREASEEFIKTISETQSEKGID